MNIMEYRAMKEAEASAPAVPTQPEPTPPATPPSPEVTTPTPTETPATPASTPAPTVPDKVTIDGVGEVTLDELKNGYLRQSDYTKKTQEVSNQRKEAEQALLLMNQLKQNPQLAQQVGQHTQLPPSVDPATSRVVELENKLYDMMLDQEISKLSQKYTDFEVRDVLNVAHEKGLTNLEDAYLLAKSRKAPATPAPQVNQEELKQQLRAQILAEIESERNATHTIISSNGNSAPQTDNTPKITADEQKVARMMKMSDGDYVKWRDVQKR